MSVKQMDSYSYWMCRLWVCLLATKIVAIAAATRSPRVRATSKGQAVSSAQEEADHFIHEDQCMCEMFNLMLLAFSCER